MNCSRASTLSRLATTMAFLVAAACGSDNSNLGTESGIKLLGSDAGANAENCAVPTIAVACPDGSYVGFIAYIDENGKCARRSQPCAGGTAGATGTAGTVGGTGTAGKGSGTAGSSGGTAGVSGGLGEGESCGGKATLVARACGKGLFCMHGPGRCNTPPDDSGTCQLKPTVCTAEYRPVCGCDGKTYGNDCARMSAAVSLDHEGECTTGGKTPGKEGDTCGGFAGLTCGDKLYCEFPAGSCRVADGTGFCKIKSEACTLIYAPVCGCDGKTYGNDCARAGAGVTKDYDGECKTTTTTTLKTGVWGGTGAILTVKDAKAGGSLKLDCASATINGPLTVNDDGTFKWTGTYTREAAPSRPTFCRHLARIARPAHRPRSLAR